MVRSYTCPWIYVVECGLEKGIGEQIADLK